jgi:hypothetical protein
MITSPHNHNQNYCMCHIHIGLDSILQALDLSNYDNLIKSSGLTPLYQAMTPETRFGHQNTKDTTMPITMITPLSHLPLVLSSPPHLVLETPLSLLITLDKIPSQEEDVKNGTAPCTDAPCQARACTTTSWTRQYTSLPHRLSSPLHLSLRVHAHLDVSYLLDIAIGPRSSYRRRPRRRPPPRVRQT